MGRYKILSEEEISKALEDLPDWEIVAGEIAAEFVFLDFRTAISFIMLVAIESEVMNHHPEWSNSYNKVGFSFCTHDAGNKITDLDIKMAKYISKAASQCGGKTKNA